MLLDSRKEPELRNPAAVKPSIRRLEDGQLELNRLGKKTLVHATLCFPWSHPRSFISLRNGENEEIYLVSELNQLDSDSQIAISQALDEAGFCFEISRVDEIEEEFELRNWKVMTRQGVRHFQTKLNEFPEKTPNGGLLMRDIAGDLFIVKEPLSLDEKSRKTLWAFLD